MKHLNLLLFVLFCVPGIAQHKNNGPVIPPGTSYHDACDIAEAYFQRNYATEQQHHPAFADDAYTEYQRWKWFYAGRVDATGHVPDPALMYAERDARFPQNRSMVSPWVSISQDTSEGGYSNMGRTVCVAFDPVDPNTFYTGSAQGGLWKTTDGGTNWTPLTDQLPYTGVTHCVVDPTSPNTIYIIVGYPYSWTAFSKGVYKSTDGGLTWNATALAWTPTYTYNQYYYARKLLMDPLNPAILYVITNRGLFKSTDSGTSWNQADSLNYTDLEFEPGTSNLYGAVYDLQGSSEVYRSTDGAATWTVLSAFGTPFNALELSVTPANPAMLAVNASANTGLYVSTNYGSNLVYASVLPEDWVVQISPTNDSVMYCGGLSIYKSTDAGSTWTQITHWYDDQVHDVVHADQRATAFHPLNPDRIFFCNDGGLYHYSENNTAWTDMSDRLIITQFYRIAHSVTDPMIVLGGTQDNGGRLRDNNGGWRPTNGGDAMEVAVDPVNDSVMYSTYTYGTLYRSLDRWTGGNVVQISWNIPGQPAGNWVTPYVLDPSDHNTIVAGYNEVWRSTDRGNTWMPLSNSIASSTIEHLTVAPSDPNTIWISYGTVLKMTSNMGLSWSTIPLPGTPTISSIVIHPANAQHVWVTCNGYDAGNKVFYSANAGASWTNISGSLPNTPVNIGVYENGSADLIYIGTDAGVYYRDTLNTSWQLLGTGMPNTFITDLEIFYPTRKIRAATYGRGIFETDLSSPVGIATPASAQTGPSLLVYPNPNNGEFDIRFQSQNNSEVHLRVLDVFGKTVYETYASGSNIRRSIALPGVAAGTYFVLAEQDGKMARSRVTVR